MNNCLDKVNNENKECFVSGDFNIDLLRTDNNPNFSKFIHMMSSVGFLPHILEPSRISNFSSTLIDNIYSNLVCHDIASGNILLQFADHLSQFISISKCPEKVKNKPFFIRDYSNFNEEAFKDDLEIQNWDTNDSDDTNNKFNDFLWRLDGAVNRHVPLKKLNIKNSKLNSNPWITKYVLKLITRRNLIHSKLKADPNNTTLKRSFKLFRNRITREIRKAKKHYYNNYFSNNLNNLKKTWKGIKNIINLTSKSNNDIPQIKTNNHVIDDNLTIANTFNNFFVNIGSELDKKIPKSQKPNGPSKYLKNRNPNSFLISPTTPSEICDIIGSLDDTKSSGPNSIPIKLLKIGKDTLSTQLCNIYNLSF